MFSKNMPDLQKNMEKKTARFLLTPLLLMTVFFAGNAVQFLGNGKASDGLADVRGSSYLAAADTGAVSGAATPGGVPNSDQAASNNSANPPADSSATDPNNLCAPKMKKLADDELKVFRAFLEKNFQNKSSTGSLLDNAIEKYREIRKEMMDEYAKYYPNVSSSLLVTLQQPGICLQIIQETLGDARVLLKIHASHTSGVKKSAALLEKYQSINNQLSNMAREFMTMKSLLDTFSQKLPCYVKKGECLRN